MNSRWTSRILGLIMVIIFLLVLMNLQKQLLLMQRQHTPQTTTAPATRR